MPRAAVPAASSPLGQPVGVGFSYASWADKSRKDPAPGRIYDAEAAARDASAFLQLWGMHAKELFKNDGVTSFHIAGACLGPAAS